MGMDGSYIQLDAIGEELRTWLAERMVDCGNLEPRQEKLEGLSKFIQPAEQPEDFGNFGELAENPEEECADDEPQAIADSANPPLGAIADQVRMTAKELGD